MSEREFVLSNELGETATMLWPYLSYLLTDSNMEISYKSMDDEILLAAKHNAFTVIFHFLACVILLALPILEVMLHGAMLRLWALPIVILDLLFHEKIKKYTLRFGWLLIYPRGVGAWVEA